MSLQQEWFEERAAGERSKPSVDQQNSFRGCSVLNNLKRNIREALKKQKRIKGCDNDDEAVYNYNCQI